VIKKFKLSRLQGFIYLIAALLIFIAPIFVNFNPLSGHAPNIKQAPLSGKNIQNPNFIYFWADWCRVCEKMHPQISNILNDYSGITVAVTSGGDAQLQTYLDKQHLDWLTINDENGDIAKQYFVETVPTFFVLNSQGEIAFVALGYMSEWRLRLRLWLAT